MSSNTVVARAYLEFVGVGVSDNILSWYVGDSVLLALQDIYSESLMLPVIFSSW